MPFPDGIRFADNATVIEAGKNYTAVLQVTYGGGDYPKPNIGIYLSSDNMTIIKMPEESMTGSNSTGIALYNFTAGDVPGNFTLTARMLDRTKGIGVSKKYYIVKYGNISGIVKDGAGTGIAGAQVTLYSYKNGNRSDVQISGNPAVTAGNDTGVAGSYTFGGVPTGLYYIEASANGAKKGLNYTFTTGTISADIALTGYVAPTPTPAPTIVPSPTPDTGATPTTLPTTVPTPTAKPASSSGDMLKQVWWMVTIALILAGIIVAVKILRGRL